MTTFTLRGQGEDSNTNFSTSYLLKHGANEGLNLKKKDTTLIIHIYIQLYTYNYIHTSYCLIKYWCWYNMKKMTVHRRADAPSIPSGFSTWRSCSFRPHRSHCDLVSVIQKVRSKCTL